MADQSQDHSAKAETTGQAAERNSHRRLDAKRSTIEYLPAYAPELNPVELVWSSLKGSKRTNIFYKDAKEVDDWVMAHLSEFAQDTLALG